MTDLRGRRLVVGPEQSGMTQHARVILGALGLTFADVTPIFLDFATGADALARGEADAQLQCPIPNKVMTALAARVLLRVLPYAPADLDTVLRAVPFYRRTMMRQGAIRGLDADVAQAAVVNVLVTHARTPRTMSRGGVGDVHRARRAAALNALFDGIARCSSRCGRTAQPRSNSAASRFTPAHSPPIGRPACLRNQAASSA